MGVKGYKTCLKNPDNAVVSALNAISIIMGAEKGGKRQQKIKSVR